MSTAPTATAPQAHAPTERALIDRLSGLAPLLAENARQAELDRKPVDAVMQAIEATGAYKYFVPKRYGGYEFSLPGFMEVGMNLGGACLSTAWVTTFCMEHNWLLALYGQEAQDDIFGKHPYIIAPGSLAPKGKATPVDGGYRVTGRWQWGTGVMHANWAMIGAMMPKPDSKEMTLGMFVVEIDQVEVIDTWHIDGMVGTGSNDIAVNDVFVPAHRVVDLATVRDGTSAGARWHDTPTFKMPMMPVLGLTAAAPAVGAARAAVGQFKQWLEERTMYGTTTQQSERAVAQTRLGHALVEAESIEQQLLATAHAVAAWGEHDEPCPEAERGRLRLHIAHVVRRSRNVVRDAVEACGASVHYLHNPLQRAQRDLNTLSCHTVFDMDVGGELHGRMALGLEPNSPV